MGDGGGWEPGRNKTVLLRCGLVSMLVDNSGHKFLVVNIEYCGGNEHKSSLCATVYSAYCHRYIYSRVE